MGCYMLHYLAAPTLHAVLELRAVVSSRSFHWKTRGAIEFTLIPREEKKCFRRIEATQERTEAQQRRVVYGTNELNAASLLNEGLSGENELGPVTHNWLPPHAARALKRSAFYRGKAIVSSTPVADSIDELTP
ncbi:hypothetical protein NMY22_g12029 [Coprinellus aureogranulatus]|nr:hypothetical protein NMY22_g12029 [Coprinellus aureogranulatus]